MKRVVLNVQAMSPLAIRSDHAPGGADTAKYIPGTALTGCLASVYRMSYPDDEENFQRLFLQGEVQYPNLYPGTFEDDKAPDDSSLIYPLPRTAESCKRFSGFSYVSPNQ